MSVAHLYIHVPFCARRCSYCDFSIAVRSTTPVDEYVTALGRELGAGSGGREAGGGKREAGSGKAAVIPALDGSGLETVYMGGGTPSRLGGEGVARVLALVRDHAGIAAGAEITIEANPDDVNDVAVAHWVAAGVNRVSLGAQSFDDDALKWMHRTHDAAQIGTAVKTLHRGGIDNISLDLIFALPEHLNRSWNNDLDRALDLDPSHLSLYGLTLEPKTPLARWADRGAIVEGSEEEYEEEFLAANSTMVRAGFEHYEVSNFARSGLASRHNSAYWSGAPYLGVGPSAHSFDGAVRRWNVSAYSEWIRRLTNGDSAMGGEESLTADNRGAEEVYLGLRTRRGVEIADDQLPELQSWADSGWAIVEEELGSTRIRLTPTGWLRLDSLAADLTARRARWGNAGLGATCSHCYI